MTFVRSLLIFLGLLLLCLIAGAVYILPQLPALVERQAKSLLAPYGTQNVTLSGVRFDRHALTFEQITIEGLSGGNAYLIELRSPRLDYHWRQLLSGNADTLSLPQLDISVRQTSSSATVDSETRILPPLPPAVLAQASPLLALKLQHWTLEYLPMEGTPIRAQGSVNWERELQLSLRAHTGNDWLEGTIGVPAGSTTAALHLSLNSGDSELAVIDARVQEVPEQHWQWQINGHADYHALSQRLSEQDATLGDLHLDGLGRFTATVTHPLTLPAPLTLGTPLLKQLSLKLQLDSAVKQLSYAGLVEQLGGHLTTNAAWDGTQLHCTVKTPGLVARLQGLDQHIASETLQWLHWESPVAAELQLIEPLSIRSNDLSHWLLEVHKGELTLGSDDTLIRVANIDINAAADQDAALFLAASIDATVATTLRKTPLPSINIALNTSGPLASTVLDLRLADAPASLELELQGTANMDSGEGDYIFALRSADLSLTAEMLTAPLQSLEIVEQAPVITSGSMALVAKLQSQGFESTQWQQQSTLTVEQTSGTLGEYAFEGLNLDASWFGIEQWQTLQPAALAIERVDIGIDVTGINASVTLPQPTPMTAPTLAIETFSAALFGGQLSLSAPSTWDTSAASNKLNLSVEDWQLAEIVALQQDQDIEAQGVIEGQLPMTLQGARLSIDGGFLSALAPGGRIRYLASDASEALASNSSELSLALGLLTDFQYDLLDSEVHLDQKGNLLLVLSLAGRNPGHFSGREIRFNINLEQNLYPLLHSLRLSDNLTDRIESGIQ